LTLLQGILAAREERQTLRHQANAQGTAAVSMNLNIPGTPKTNLLYARFFEVCREQLKRWLLANRVLIEQEKETSVHHAAGDFYIAPLKSSFIKATELKQIAERFEQSHRLGRFIDVDVTDENGVLLSSGKSKLCFFCQAHPAMDCIHSKRHSTQELRAFQQQEINVYLHQERLARLSHRVSSIAIRSILYELSLTPKPGLVDTAGSGIHTDMDFRTFIDSTAVISTYFAELFMKGANCAAGDLPHALPVIRTTGLEMEKEMFLQTQGINTQKGIIFLMGISLFSAGFTLKENDKFNADFFVTTVKKVCKSLTETEFINQTETATHGELCFQKYHTGGIRSEAEHGFPTIFLHSLPVLERENNTGSLALYKTLVSVMSVLNDTNILYRSDMNILLTFQDLCKRTLAEFSMEAYEGITDFCVKNKISPGGSADLLSLTIFVFLLKTELL